MTLAALAKECQSGNIPNGARVVLGVGLPLKQFATVRKQFVKYLKRGNQPVHFKFEDVHMILPLKMYWHFRSVMQQWQTGLAV